MPISEEESSMDFTNTPDDLLLPDMFYNWEITGLDILEAGSNKTMCNVCNQPRGKKGIKVTFTVLEPVDYKGAQVNDNYWIGTDTDPCAHHPLTLVERVFGTINFKHLLKTVQVPLNQMKGIVGKRCQRSTVIADYTDRTTGEARKINNFARGIFPIGTVPVGQPTAARQGSQSSGNGPAAQQQQKMIPCPRCKKEFSSLEIDDHVSSHLPG